MRIDVATHELLRLIRRFDDSGEWGHQGARSMAHWLTWRVGMGLRAAQERVRVARVLGELPALDGALSSGRLSYSKVRAIARVGTPQNVGKLIDLAIHSTGSQLERACRAYRNTARGVTQRPEDDRWENAGRRFVRRLSGPDGMVRIEIQLPADEAEVIYETLASTAAAAKAEPQHVYERRLADAAVTVCEAFRDESPERFRGAVHGLMIHTTPAALRRNVGEGPAGMLEDGTLLDPSVLRRIASDAAIVVARRGRNGEVLDVGRSRRTIPPAIRRALQIRDGGCRFPGCCNRRHLDAHHIEHWVDGGETKLDNLVTLCRFHHRAIHERGFSIRRRDGHFEFLDPQGETIDRVPQRPVSQATFELSAWPEHGRTAELDFTDNHPQWPGGPIGLEFWVEALLKTGAPAGLDVPRNATGRSSPRDRPDRPD